MPCSVECEGRHRHRVLADGDGDEASVSVDGEGAAEEGFDGGALAAADVADDDAVRVGEGVVCVELEGVVMEGGHAGGDVDAEVGAAGAEGVVGVERVGGAEVRHGGAVPVETKSWGRVPQRRPVIAVVAAAGRFVGRV